MTGIQRLLAVAAIALGLLGAPPAGADWRLYGSGELGYSILDAEAGGQVVIAGTLPLKGDHVDVSPLIAGAFGVAIPLSDALPRYMTGRTRLPEWPVRFEIEGVGLRDYDLRTGEIAPGTGPIHTRVKSWGVMGNGWLDLPMSPLYDPISWTSARLFGRWRLRTLRQTLERMTFEVGPVGVGLSGVDAKVREADAQGSRHAYHFAWQAGAGFGYRLTERVKLTVGYRYVDIGDVKIPLSGGGIPVNSNSYLKLDNDVHEVRAGLRMLFYEFPSPWH